MASNTFGEVFKITSFGESHGPAIGLVIDGCPSGIDVSEQDFQSALEMRGGGSSPFVTARKEADTPRILSGVFGGKTTGAPIALVFDNGDTKSEHYEPIKDTLRPGHANFTYMEKYGVFDWRGGGRSSARETVCRVAAGVIADKILKAQGIDILSYLKKAEGKGMEESPCITEEGLEPWKKRRAESAVFCPEPLGDALIKQAVKQAVEEGDSIGGVVETIVYPLPPGLGEPVYQKVEARLAFAMLSIPASKGFEIGAGFMAASMRGSRHNDSFILKNDRIETETNNAGGTLGGITTGMPLVFRVAFKPTSSIKKEMKTVTLDARETVMKYPEGSRHDPCVAIRAVAVVEAMTKIVLADLLLMSRSSRI
ncbi:chorismate synthase [Estrella lausannensis]|uniref:Chorismate synthase n=1 Tax=Estrella lausannensis TaxID=483423 RepID=A0A0H5DRP1_9BACT|nr:chorismate synthase [Estrella lausannensis]CRX39376.1 Chorismate synthase [Estrella lausannensis]